MRAVIATLSLALLSTLAHADAACDAKATEKKLAGAAKSSFLKKCEKDAGAAAAPTCASKAVDKNGKALAGAAKAASIKKCEKDAAAPAK
jgi:hypothetical protein